MGEGICCSPRPPLWSGACPECMSCCLEWGSHMWKAAIFCLACLQTQTEHFVWCTWVYSLIQTWREDSLCWLFERRDVGLQGGTLVWNHMWREKVGHCARVSFQLSWPLGIPHCSTLPSADEWKHQEWTPVPGSDGVFRARCLLSRPAHSPLTATDSVLFDYAQSLYPPAETPLTVTMNGCDFPEWNMYPWTVLTIGTNSHL